MEYYLLYCSVMSPFFLKSQNLTFSVVSKTMYYLAPASFLLPIPFSSSLVHVYLMMELRASWRPTPQLSYFSRPTSLATLSLSSCKTQGSLWGWGIVLAANHDQKVLVVIQFSAQFLLGHLLQPSNKKLFYKKKSSSAYCLHRTTCPQLCYLITATVFFFCSRQGLRLSYSLLCL